MKKEFVKVKFLGTAANGGIPQADCRCARCKTGDLIRKRSCILVKYEKEKFAIDCGPDFHSQLIENNLRLQDISGIIISHLHWDHCVGLVELSAGKHLNFPIIVSPEIEKVLKNHQMFGFLFKNKWARFSHSNKHIEIGFVKIPHGVNFSTFAIKIEVNKKRILIATDLCAITPQLLGEIKKTDLFICDGTFLHESKYGHISIEDSVKVLACLNKRIVFTHINHSEDTNRISRFIRRHGFKLAFDGMTVKV